MLVGIRIAVVEHTHGGDHDLLGGETRDEGDPHLPVEAEGTEDRRDEPTELSDVGVLNLAGRTVELQLRNLRLPLALRQGGVRPYPLNLRRVTIDLRSGVREILQRPDDDGGHQNDRTHLLEVLHALVPHVDDGVAEGRDTVGRQLHYELVALLLEGRLFDNQRGDNGHHHPEKVDGGEDQPLMLREEGGNEEQIDGQPRRTGHEGHGDDGEDAVLTVFERARGHDGRHTAAETDNIRYKGFAVKSHAVHELVHDEGGAGHVAGVLQDGDEEEEDQDVRQERADTAHPRDDAIDEQVFDDAVGQHPCGDIAEPAEEAFEPRLRIGTQREGHLEHKPEEENQDGKAQPSVRQDFVGGIGGLLVAIPPLGEGFEEGTAHETVLRAGDDGGGILIILFLDLFPLLVSHLDDTAIIVKLAHHLGDHLVAGQQLDGEVAGGIGSRKVQMFHHILLDDVDGLLQVGAVVDMDVFGVLLQVLVEIHDLGHHLLDAGASRGDRRDDGEAEEFAEGVDIKLVAVFLQFVVHIEGHHHGHVHVDELGGEEEVAFEVRGIDDVEHDVGVLLHNVLADVAFFRGVFGKGVGAGKVGNHDGIILIVVVADLGIDGDAAVVAHLLAHAGGVVEEGGLAAVGVADEGNVDAFAFMSEDAFGLLGDGAVEAVVVGHLLSDGDDLHAAGLHTAQGDMSAHDLVLDGVAQGGIADHLDLLAAHKSHLHEAVTETSVARHAHNHAVLAGLHIGERQHFPSIFVVFHNTFIE